MDASLSVGGNPYSAGSGPTPSLLIGTTDGLWRATREQGASWKAAQIGLAGLHVSSIVREQASGKLFAGTHQGGLFSSDDGAEWSACRGIEQENVYALAVGNAGNRVRVYAGTEPPHLYVSEDAGVTWTDLPAVTGVEGTADWIFPGPPHIPHVKYIAPDPAEADTVYVCVEQGALLRTRNGGKTFEMIFDAKALDAHRLTAPAAALGSLFFTRGDWSGGGEGLYVSEDSGETWDRRTDRALIGYPDATLIHPDNPNLLFMAGATTSPGDWPKQRTAASRVARSRDAGRTWEVLAGVPVEGATGNIESMAMHSWNGGYELFACGTDGDLYYSDDEGGTWSAVVEGLPAVSKAAHWRWRERLRAA